MTPTIKTPATKTTDTAAQPPQPRRTQRQSAAPARDPEKWKPVFGKDHAQNNKPENERDLAALRLSIMRKMAMVLGHALICPDRQCRRVRRCVGADMRCMQMPLPPVSEEEGAARLAEFQKALKRSLAGSGPAGR